MQTSGDANLAKMAAMAAAAPAATASIRPAPALRFPAIAIAISLFVFSPSLLYKGSETWVLKTPTAFEEPGFENLEILESSGLGDFLHEPSNNWLRWAVTGWNLFFVGLGWIHQADPVYFLHLAF
jgi:hypothetical protein